MMDTMTDRARVCVCDDSETNTSDANSFFRNLKMEYILLHQLGPRGGPSDWTVCVFRRLRDRLIDWYDGKAGSIVYFPPYIS